MSHHPFPVSLLVLFHRIFIGIIRLSPFFHYVPESGNWHDGTYTRWIAALPAATT